MQFYTFVLFVSCPSSAFMCAALQRLTHCLSQLFLLKDPTLSSRKNTSPEEWPTWTRAVLRGDKSLRPTTDYPFPSFFPSAPLGVGLLLGQRFPAPGTTETGASPSSRSVPTRPFAIAYLSHFGNSLLPGRGGGRHDCSRRPRANPGPQKSALRVRERPKTF